MTLDPIADLLTRIRNAGMARKETLTIPHSKIKMGILKVIKERGFITEFGKVKNESFDEIEITLNQERGVITLKQISKPGQRIYVKSGTLRKVNGGLGVAIISTPKGIISGEQAKKLKVGGELICEIY